MIDKKGVHSYGIKQVNAIKYTESQIHLKGLWGWVATSDPLVCLAIIFNVYPLFTDPTSENS